MDKTQYQNLGDDALQSCGSDIAPQWPQKVRHIKLKRTVLGL
jgi:hypothetical protein